MELLVPSAVHYQHPDGVAVDHTRRPQDPQQFHLGRKQDGITANPSEKASRGADVCVTQAELLRGLLPPDLLLPTSDRHRRVKRPANSLATSIKILSCHAQPRSRASLYNYVMTCVCTECCGYFQRLRILRGVRQLLRGPCSGHSDRCDVEPGINIWG